MQWLCYPLSGLFFLFCVLPSLKEKYPHSRKFTDMFTSGQKHGHVTPATASSLCCPPEYDIGLSRPTPSGCWTVFIHVPTKNWTPFKTCECAIIIYWEWAITFQLSAITNRLNLISGWCNIDYLHFYCFWLHLCVLNDAGDFCCTTMQWQ